MKAAEKRKDRRDAACQKLGNDRQIGLPQDGIGLKSLKTEQ
jgi:hypothetical protein